MRDFDVVGMLVLCAVLGVAVLAVYYAFGGAPW